VVKMDLRRLARHLSSTPWRVRRAFPPEVMAEITAAVQAAELTHGGEIRFAVEDALDPWALLRGQTPRERAIEVFSQLRVWDTQHNNGVLVYLLLADHALEIVADRGIHALEAADTWNAICRQIEPAFRRGEYRAGALAGIASAAQVLRRHFPHEGGDANELTDQPVLL
jgi:uncharacterized membrane protein